MQALRARRQRTHAEYRKPDVAQFLAVTMEAPYDKARYPGGLGFQYYYVAYAGFVQPGAVVNHQDIARPCPLERLEENVDTSDVPNWPRSTSTPHSGEERLNTRRRKTYGNASAQAAVRQIWRGQPIELVDQCFAHSTLLSVCALLTGFGEPTRLAFEAASYQPMTVSNIA